MHCCVMVENGPKHGLDQYGYSAIAGNRLQGSAWLRFTVRALITPKISRHNVSKRVLPGGTCGDSLSARAVIAWLARHPRWTFHFIPASSSWLNAVEGFFAELTRRRLKHGVFKSVGELKGAIDRFIAEHNDTEAKPFVWRVDPDEIIAARNRGFQTLESTQ
jgi:hypothetical protein